MNLNDPNLNVSQSFDGGSDGQNENATFPLGTSDSGFDADSALDPLSGAESAKRSSSGTLLIVLVILVAAGGLFSMRTLAKVTASAQADTEVESSIQTFLAALGNEGGSTATGKSVLLRDDSASLTVLSETYSEHQVPLVNVQRNPFVLQSQSKMPVVTDEPGNNAYGEERLRREKLLAIERAGKNLSLSMVMMGSTPMALLNGKNLRVGDTLTLENENVTFRVKEIETEQVTLVGEDEQLNVHMEVVARIKRN